MMAGFQETQFESAQRMYSRRAADYEDSWHPEYTERFMAVADVRSGEHVLIMACGTGLEAVIAAPLVGEKGQIVGVDATAAMLDEARKKQDANQDLASRVKFIQHDVKDLSARSDIAKGAFDVVLCSNAFVLFEDPAKVVRHWREYLKASGRMVIDITHEHNLRSGRLMENVAQRLGVAYPSNRRWIKGIESFREVLESEGLAVEKIATVEKEEGKGTAYWDVAAADGKFDTIMGTALSENLATEEYKAKARPLFREEWAAAAVNGKVEVTDILYVYVAKKA